MFEQLEDLREKPLVHGWHGALGVLCVFLAGINIGLLVAVRNWDFSVIAFAVNALLVAIWLTRALSASARSRHSPSANNGH